MSEPGSAMTKCQNCAGDGHDICWDTKPDRTCPCCLDTWFGMLCEPTRPGGAFDYDRPTHTHRVVVTFQMEEMNGTPEESAEVLLDLYVADEVTVLSVDAMEGP